MFVFLDILEEDWHRSLMCVSSCTDVCSFAQRVPYLHLQVLFNRDLERHMEDIKVFHRVASGQDRQRPKARNRHYLHAKGEHEES